MTAAEFECLLEHALRDPSATRTTYRTRVFGELRSPRQCITRDTNALGLHLCRLTFDMSGFCRAQLGSSPLDGGLVRRLVHLLEDCAATQCQ